MSFGMRQSADSRSDRRQLQSILSDFCRIFLRLKRRRHGRLARNNQPTRLFKRRRYKFRRKPRRAGYMALSDILFPLVSQIRRRRLLQNRRKIRHGRGFARAYLPLPRKKYKSNTRPCNKSHLVLKSMVFEIPKRAQGRRHGKSIL